MFGKPSGKRMNISRPRVSTSQLLGTALGRSHPPGVDHPGVELDWLETFLAVVDRGGFTAASEHVHRSQSRVSAHIAGLERELGVRLIDRTRRPATVTPAGRVLARHAREIVAGVGSARSAVGALRAVESAALSVLTTPCIAGVAVPRGRRRAGRPLSDGADHADRAEPRRGRAQLPGRWCGGRRAPDTAVPVGPRPAGTAAVAGTDPAGRQPRPRPGPAVASRFGSTSSPSIR